MLDWMDMLFGGVAAALLAVAWLAWQRFAARADPGMRDRKPVGRCCVPKNLDEPGGDA